MHKALFAIAATTFFFTSAPALAGAESFTVVNGTKEAMTSLSIRRTGTQDWRPLSAAPAPGASAGVSFSDPDCAFDFRASLASGGSAVWSGVNLCGTSRLTLQRRSSGETWVEYD